MAWGLKPSLEKVGAVLMGFEDLLRRSFTLLGCLCRCGVDHSSGEGGRHEEAAGADVVSKQPKRKRPPKKTVEQNLSNINSAESERRCEVQRRHCTMSILHFSRLFELLHV